MQSTALYYFQMALSYLNVLLQCFMYVGVGYLAIRVTGPAVRALKLYIAAHKMENTVAPAASPVTPMEDVTPAEIPDQAE